MSNEVIFRETDGLSATPEEWDAIEHVLVTRGWASLSRQATPKLFLVDDKDGLAGFFIVQFVAHAGPMWVKPKYRGTGVPEELAARLRKFLVDCKARGVVIVADNPQVAAMCQEQGMKQIESPVFVLPGAGV